MAIIVIHGAEDLRPHVLTLAQLFDVDCILTDRTGDIPFPTRRALLLTRRTPAEVARWRRESLPKAGALSAEGLVFIRAATALALLKEQAESTPSESLPKTGVFPQPQGSLP